MDPANLQQLSADGALQPSAVSPNVAAGVLAMESMADNIIQQTSSASENDDAPDSDDMVVRNKILLSRAHSDRVAKERAEDDLRYSRHLLKQRDKQLEEDRELKQRNHAKIGQLQCDLAEKESIIHNMKAASSEARALIHTLQQENARLKDDLNSSKKSLSLSQQRSSESGTTERATYIAGRFKEMHKDKVKIIRLQRKIEQMQKDREQHSQNMEMAMMEKHDTYVANPVTILSAEEALNGTTQEDDDIAAKYLQGKPKLITYDALRRNGRKGALPFDEPLDLRMPEDGYITAKSQRSSFNDSLLPLKGEMTKMAHEWKAFMDTTLSSLWYIFQEQEKKGRSILANPRDDFMKEVHNTLKRTKVMLFQMMKSVNTNVKTVLNHENAVKVQWVKEARPSKEIGCQADIPPPEDPRIGELNTKVDFLSERLATLREETSRKVESLELEKEKAEVNTQFLQNKVFALHEGVYGALHAVYKHRFHWIHRLPNNFAQIDKNASKRKQLEVRFNVNLAKAIDEDVKLLVKFTDYFVSDDTFGVDLSSAKNEKDASLGTISRRKEGVPVKKKIDQARKLSNDVNTLLKKEESAFGEEFNSQQSSACNTPTGDSLTPTAKSRRPSFAALPKPPAGDPQAPTTAAPLKRRGSFGNTSSSYAPIVSESAAPQPQAASAPAQPSAGSENVNPKATGSKADLANHRMEQWQKKQHDMWEQKKARQFNGAHSGMSTMMLQLDPTMGCEVEPASSFGSFENNRPHIGYRRTSISQSVGGRRGSLAK